MHIDKKVPIPRLRQEYPYAVLEVGDSFLIEGKTIHSVCNMNTRAMRKYEIVLIARKVEGGVRVWRTG